MDKIKERRFYKAGDTVYSIYKQKDFLVKDVRPTDKEMTVIDFETGEEYTDKFWAFDKLRDEEGNLMFPMKWAKFRDTATIPHKGHPEDAGYDVYLDIPKDFKTTSPFQKGEVDAWTKNDVGEDVLRLYVPCYKPTLLPTGVGVSVPTGFYTDWANERGSTGKLGMKMLSGVVDSNYRGEVFVNMLPKHNIFITNLTDEVIVETYPDSDIIRLIHYPYSKAVSQMIPRELPKLRDIVIPLEMFQEDKTSRGDSKLDSTNK